MLKLDVDLLVSVPEFTYLHIIFHKFEIILLVPRDAMISTQAFIRLMHISTDSERLQEAVLETLSRGTPFPIRLQLRPTKTRISLRIRAV